MKLHGFGPLQLKNLLIFLYCSNFKTIFQILIYWILNIFKLFFGVSELFSNLKSQKYITTLSKMQNFSDLGHFKLKVQQKCITFEPKLGFFKLKSPNRSEFHQKSEFRSIFGAICSKIRIRSKSSILGASEIRPLYSYVQVLAELYHEG